MTCSRLLYMCLLVVFLAMATALEAEEPCTCDQVTADVEDLRKFLTNPEKLTLNNILPGELSPYVCDCNRYRQRRSDEIVHPKVAAQPFFSSTLGPQTPKPFFDSKDKKCTKRKQELGIARCATGYVRIGMFCIVDPCYNRY